MIIIRMVEKLDAEIIHIVKTVEIMGIRGTVSIVEITGENA